MARTAEQIYEAIVAEKNGYPELNGLNNPSKTAIWRLWAYIQGSVMHVHEQLWETAREELNQLARNQQVGTAAWYVRKAREFRQGDSLEFDPATNQVRYPDSAVGPQIVAYASISGVGASSVMKVAKEDGGPTPLSSGELDQFRAYIDRLQFAGSQIVCQSQPADLLNLSAEVYYDGSEDLPGFQTAFQTALNTYLQQTPFDGRILRNELIDAAQAVPGCRDFHITLLEGKNALSSSFSPIGRVYSPLAGYAQFNSLNLSYTAE